MALLAQNTGMRRVILIIVVLGLGIAFFQWLRVPPAVLESSVDGSMRRPRAARHEASSSDEPEQPLHLAAMAEATAKSSPDTAGELHGVVRDHTTSAPIAAAEITFMRELRAYDVSAGPDGSFAFVAPEPGRYDLVNVTAVGYTPFTDDWTQPAVSFVAMPGTSVDGIVLILRPEPPPSVSGAAPLKTEATVSGTVVGPDSKPIADATVSAWSPRNQRTFTEHTDERGAFSIAVPSSAKLVLEASHRGFRPSSLRTKAGARDLRLTLTRGTTLRGQVVGEGKPVRAFTLTVDGDGGMVQQTFLDPEGTFTITGLPDGEAIVRAYALGWAPSRPMTIDLSADREAIIKLERGGSITGRVLDEADKRPIAGARVSTESRWLAEDSPMPVVAEARTDATGSFTILGLGAGLRSITVDAAGYNPRIASGFSIADDGDVGPVDITVTKVAPGEQPRLELVGIGATVEVRDGAFVLLGVMPGGGGSEAGLTSGDRIVAIDGTATQGLSFEDGIEQLRGTEGSRVVLTVERDGTRREVTVTRRRVRS